MILKRQGDEGYSFEGFGDYIAPEIDKSTGTLQLRAKFFNQDDRLRPGYFVNLRIYNPSSKLKDPMLIPEMAINRDQAGTFLLTAAPQDGAVVQRKNVKVGGTRYGKYVMVTPNESKADEANALKPDDWVIIEGVQRARPGSKVKPTQTKLDAPPLPKGFTKQEIAE